MAEAEFEVGGGSTGSGYPIKEALFIYDKERGVFTLLDEKNAEAYGVKVLGKSTYYSSKKYFKTLHLDLPEGSVVKYYQFYRKGSPSITYYTVRNGELVSLNAETVDEIIGEEGADKIVLRSTLLPEINLKVPEFIFVKGPTAATLDLGIKPVSEKGKIREIAEEIINFLREKKVPRVSVKATTWVDYLEKRTPEEKQRIISRGAVGEGSAVLYVEGDTWRIKDELKKLGFKWTGYGWALSLSEMCARGGDVSPILSSLERAGVKISEEEREHAERVCRNISDMYRDIRERCGELESRAKSKYPDLSEKIAFRIKLDGSCIAKPTKFLGKEWADTRKKLEEFGCEWSSGRGEFICLPQTGINE